MWPRLQVWDPEALADTSEAALQHRHKLTPYEDMELHGRVEATFVRGHQVFTSAKLLPKHQVCGKKVLRQTL
jgi:allantoinase